MSLAPKLAVPASVPSSVPAKAPRNGLTHWLLQHRVQPVGPEAAEAQKAWHPRTALSRRPQGASAVRAPA